MEELISALLSGLAELLLEVFLQVIVEALTGLIVRSVQNRKTDSKENNPVQAGAGYLLLGALCGGMSVFLLPHPLVHPSGFHGISLLISPALTGLFMAQVGIARRRQGKNVIPLESFGYGFVFALGMATVRLLFVK